MTDDVITIGGNIDLKRQKILQRTCNRIKRIIENAEDSDIVFEALTLMTAISIKEYMMLAHENGITITEDEVYKNIIERIKKHMNIAVFIPDQTN